MKTIEWKQLKLSLNNHPLGSLLKPSNENQLLTSPKCHMMSSFIALAEMAKLVRNASTCRVELIRQLSDYSRHKSPKRVPDRPSVLVPKMYSDFLLFLKKNKTRPIERISLGRQSRCWWKTSPLGLVHWLACVPNFAWGQAWIKLSKLAKNRKMRL